MSTGDRHHRRPLFERQAWRRPYDEAVEQLGEITQRTSSADEAGPTRPRPRRPHVVRAAWLRPLASLLVGIAVLLLWIFLAGTTTRDILPGPGLVWARFLTAIGDGTYVPALLTTLEEAVLGWLVAAAVAVPLGYAIGRFAALEDAVAPYLAGSQAMPVVAIAPLLVVWLGIGLLPKVVVCALIAFFPMLATTASGVRGVPKDLRDAARVFGASGLPLALNVDLPLAARTIFAGMKVAAALSVTGAVVGEFVSADQGLGWLIELGRNDFDTPLMFVALISLMLLGALAYAAVSVVERLILRWDE